MIQLNSGTIIHQPTGTSEEYTVKLLGPGHLDELLDFQKIVFAYLERSDTYAGVTRDEFIHLLGDNGVVVGAYIRERMIGYYAILFPEEGSDNLGRDLGLPASVYHQVAHLEGAGVHPEYRGNSLQKILTGICLAQAMKQRVFRYLCATVSPYNLPSLDHAFSYGLTIRDLKQKYGGMLRYIFLRDFEAAGEVKTDSIVEVDIVDFDKQKKLLEAHYEGFSMVTVDQCIRIRFKK